MAPPVSDELDRIRGTLERYGPLPDESWMSLVPHLRAAEIPKGGLLIREGSAVRDVYFVADGLLRVFYRAGDREVTRNFVFEGRFFSNSFALHTGRPSHYEVEALEPVRAVAVAQTALDDLYHRFPAWERIGRRMAEQNFVAKERKEVWYRLSTPEERYRQILDGGGRLAARVPLRHLASYIGVTPETLSRIRARVGQDGVLDLRQG